MQPATFNELYPVWEQEAKLQNWTTKLEDTLDLMREHQGQDGTIGMYAQSIYNRLMLLPIQTIMEYNHYTDTLKSFIGRDSLNNLESHLILTLDSYLYQHESEIYRF